MQVSLCVCVYISQRNNFRFYCGEVQQKKACFFMLPLVLLTLNCLHWYGAQQLPPSHLFLTRVQMSLSYRKQSLDLGKLVFFLWYKIEMLFNECLLVRIIFHCLSIKNLSCFLIASFLLHFDTKHFLWHFAQCMKKNPFYLFIFWVFLFSFHCRKCAMISAYNNMSDVFDNLVISLCKFTSLLNSVEVRM